ncbi:unnamed protein product [Cochlearia groenlandica]
MDKSKEARRRSNMASPNEVTKRRPRISENRRVQMHKEVVTVRNRPEKKERDPESLNRSKRRRSERFASKNERDVEDNTSDEEDEDAHTKSLPSSRVPKQTASLKVANEMIGVSVPRKARSACIKRSYDCRTSSGSGGGGGGGFGDDRRRRPSSPPGSYSFEDVSPSSSNVSVKQKKNLNGSKSRIPKAPRSLSTIENDLEIEIAEVLSGLKKQHHSSKREDDSDKFEKWKVIDYYSSVGVEIGGLITCKSRIESEHPANVSKGVSKGPQLENKRDESNCGSKVEIDLTVNPTMASSPERIAPTSLVSDSTVTRDYCKHVSSVKNKENEMTPEEVKQKYEKREWLELDRESMIQPQLAKFVHQSSVLPLPVAVGSWPSGIPLQGYVPVIQNGKAVKGSNISSSSVQGSPFYASQPRPKRCATHFFIARNIQLHQHFVKTNHLSQPNKDSIYLKGDDLRPASRNSSLLGSSGTPSLDSKAQDRIADNISAPKDKASESGYFVSTRHKKSQPPHAYSSTVPAQAFIFPTNHHLQQVTIPSKSPRPTKNQYVAIGSASPNFNNQGSLASEASSPYFTVLPDNAYSFQLSSTIRGGTPGQVPPFFSGSFYSPQMFQPPQLLQKQSQTQRETKAANSSSSSHKKPQVSVIGLSSQANVQKYRQQAQKFEAKPAGDGSGSRSSHTQRGGQYGQFMTAPILPQNFSMSFASFSGGSPPANLNFSSSGYHVVSALPLVQQKNHQVNDSKIRSESCTSNAEDPKKTLPGKPPALMNGQTLVFDNPSRTLNFVSGTWPPPAATTMNGDPSPFNHHLTLQQPGRSKTMTYSQAESVPATSSLMSCSSFGLKQQFQPQQQIRTHGETQISFATPLKSQPPQEHQRRSDGSSSSSSVTGTVSHGKAATPKVSNNSKALPLSPVPCTTPLAHDQTANSASASTTQNTSPVCGRNLPPIITSCQGQMSELKY